MVRHRWKILIGIVLVFVLLTVVELTTIGDGPKKEVEAYKKSLIARGEKLKISELVPPPVPREENGVDVVIQALNMVTSEDYEESNLVPAMRIIAPGKAIVCFEQPEICDRNFTNSWSNMTAVVEDDRPMTELLKQAMNYPAIDFYLDYNENSGKQARFLMPLRWSVNRLSAEAMCDLRRGDAGSATTNICAILALVNGQRDERLEWFQIIRMSMCSLASDANWALLQSSNVNDVELAAIQRGWERQEFIRATENMLLMERAQFESEIAKMLASKDYFNKQMSWDNPQSVDWSDGWREGVHELADNAKLACSISMYRASWIYWDESQMLMNDQIVLGMLRTVETNGVFNPSYNNMVKKLEASATDEPNDWLVRWDDSGLYHLLATSSSDFMCIRLTMGAEATRRLAITAIALKRYQLKYGNYPSTLSDLAPEFVSSIPRDPIDGKPLRYRLMANGTYLLYSIAENGKDEGGDGSIGATSGPNLPSSWNSRRTLDWVWPQPATAAEIQYFYAHPTP